MYPFLSSGGSGSSSFEFGGNRVNNDGSVVLRTTSFRLTGKKNLIDLVQKNQE
jgi:hypothetical protein